MPEFRAIAIPLAMGALLLVTPSAQADEPTEPKPPGRAIADASQNSPSGDSNAATTASTDEVEIAGSPAGTDYTKPTPDQLVEARQRFDRGLALYRDGDYDLALIEFARTYEIVPDYRVLYNIAQVSVMLGRYARAREALERYVREGGDEIAEERKLEVDTDLKMLLGRTATLRVTANVAGAEVLVGDELVGEIPMEAPLLLNAGSHKVTIRAAGYLTLTKRVTLAGRDTLVLPVELTAQTVKERERIVVEKQVETGRAAPNTTVAPSLVWAGWIATGVLATGAAVTGILGMDAAGELDSLRDDPEAQRRELDDAQGRTKSLFIAADLLGAAALLTGGASLYFTILDKAEISEPGRDKGGISLASVSLGAQRFRVSGSF